MPSKSKKLSSAEITAFEAKRGRRNEVEKEPPEAAGDTSAAGLPMVARRGPGAQV